MRHLLAPLCLLIPILTVHAGDDANFTRQKDVIYGRKYGLAMTMDIFAPKKNANGLGVIWVVSGGWFSNPANINNALPQEFINRGYTVFAVVHGSQPKFTIPEILEDMHRSVRYIRFHAKDHKIDPERIGIMGGSAGGHLSLMQGTASRDGDAKSKDPIDKVSSRVQAVACFFPPTDFLNYGEKGNVALGRGTLTNYRAPFDFMRHDDKTRSFYLIDDESKRQEIGKTISPFYQVTADDAPSLIIHGDADKLVPIQQAELIVTRFKEVGVPAELVTKKGAVHGWPDINKDLVTFADWFDRHLKKVGK